MGILGSIVASLKEFFAMLATVVHRNYRFRIFLTSDAGFTAE
jgi:hypothetical protein